MYVIKRDGRQEPVHFDKITARIKKLSYGLNPDFCDAVSMFDRLYLRARAIVGCFLVFCTYARDTCV